MKRKDSGPWKKNITEEIDRFLREYETKSDIETEWGKPLVGFADAKHPYIQSLKKLISPSHSLPEDVLPGATVVMAYYIPFTRELAKTNLPDNLLASPQWARAYEETNAMFGHLNDYLIGYLERKGYQGRVSLETKTYDKEKLISNWSHRHFAYAAGLGTFGINNMLLTKDGCCGRHFTMVTDLDIKTDQPLEDEICLYKKNGSCRICIENCPMSALQTDSYDRKKCYSLLRKNAGIHKDFGSSYGKGGSEVCGKCITGSPCAFWKRK